MSRLWSVTEICENTGVDPDCVHTFVSQEWVVPAQAGFFDECDVARIRLILDLRDSLGVNEDGIPVILHLMDQLHYLRNRLLELQPPHQPQSSCDQLL